MYRAFFRFREQPFNLTPDPKFLYLNATYREALAALRYGITERKGFVSLIGEAGTGKTTLLRTLLAELPEGTRSVLVLNPAVGFDELLAFILADLGQPPRAGTPKLALLQALNTELLDTLARGGNVVVLIDEAQDLAIPVLEELRLLSNLETAKEKILQFVLAGQPELATMLARPELRQLRQRIAIPARLRPLRRREVAAYVAARLRAAGGDAQLFTRAALHRLWRFSRGVPRLINVACDNALLSAYAAGAARVGWRIAGEAVRDLREASRPEPAVARWRLRFGTVVAAALVGSIMGVGGSRLLGLSFSPSPATLPALPALGAPDTSARAGGVTTSGNVEAPRLPDAAAATVAEERAEPAVAPEAAGAKALDPPEPANATLPPSGDSNTVAKPPAGDAAPVADARPPASDAAPVAAMAAPSGEHDVALAPPNADGERQVRVEAGDTLTRIARRYYGYEGSGVLAGIKRANPSLVDLDVIEVGQTIVLPLDPFRPELATTTPPPPSPPAE